jgi:biopolymer transport protein ExbD
MGSFARAMNFATKALSIATLALMLNDCDRPEATTQPTDPTPVSNDILKIAVTRDGSISYNGTPATLEQLDVALGYLADSRGSVWYYREAGADEPHPNAMKVIEAIAKRGLPISLSTKPDYSDVVGTNSQAHSRPQ